MEVCPGCNNDEHSLTLREQAPQLNVKFLASNNNDKLSSRRAGTLKFNVIFLASSPFDLPVQLHSRDSHKPGQEPKPMELE